MCMLFDGRSTPLDTKKDCSCNKQYELTEVIGIINVLFHFKRKSDECLSLVFAFMQVLKLICLHTFIERISHFYEVSKII